MATTPLPKYAKIKDNYCVGFYGEDDAVLERLRKARAVIESELPGLRLYIVCKDEKTELFNGEPNVFPRSDLQEVLQKVAFYRELEEIPGVDPVEELLQGAA